VAPFVEETADRAGTVEPKMIPIKNVRRSMLVLIMRDRGRRAQSQRDWT